MNLKVAQTLNEIGQQNMVEISFREEYSGRGMMGETTPAIIVESWKDIIKIIAYVIEDADNLDELVEFAKLLRETSMTTDNMGYDIVVY